MKLLPLLLAMICADLIGAEPTVVMPAVRVSPSAVSLRAHCDDDGVIDKLTVKWVKPGSSAEKIGIQEGDQIIADSDGPIAGRKISAVYGPSGFKLNGRVTLEGHRGILRKKWSVTVELESLIKSKGPNKALDSKPTAGTFNIGL